MADIRKKIEKRVELPRGCGYRKPGGIYLVSSGVAVDCCKLPHILNVCPCCGAGVKFTRGWTWVNPKQLFVNKEVEDGEIKYTPKACKHPSVDCAFNEQNIPEKAGLIWIGKQFYKTPEDWLREARRMGVSRRVKGIPRGFKLGETWVLVAHINGAFIKVPNGDGYKREYKPAIFHAFRPDSLEYIVKGTETDEELEKLVERGFDLILVEPAKQEQLPLFETYEDPEEGLIGT